MDNNNLFSAGDVSVESEDLIRVGSSHFSKCPMCGECFCLKWPYRVQHVPSNSIIHLECPGCQHEFTETAGQINVAADKIQLRQASVRRIEPVSR